MKRTITAVAVGAVVALGAGLLTATSPAVAAACTSSTCPTEVSGAAYRITQSTLSNAAAVHQALGGKSTHPELSQVLADANRVMSPLSSCRPSPAGLSPKAVFGFCWNSDDQDTDDSNLWFPQGITTTADAFGSRVYEGAQAVAVTWYKRTSKTDEKAIQARISLAPAEGYQTGTNRYRHVLLVEPTGSDNFAQIPCHAGGAMWYGHLLYVACSSTIRVFDWDYLHEVKTTSLPGEGFGRQSDGGYYANGNRYVMVQVGQIGRQDNNIQFSSLALDRASAPDRLVVSGYSDTAGVNLWRFDLDAATRLPSSNTAHDAYKLPITYVQGAVTRGDRFWFSRSTTNPQLLFWDRAKKTTPVAYGADYGAESISYWSSGDGAGGVPDYLYTLTEHEGRREVFAVKQASFDG
ncbi:hypothetical protein [Micromonospora zhanjiangensis]|uniref:Secreted protein n=1 Tax=Micromonospora zhanjiangensis TaxID=1522057 RepID=A0ABV8KUV1_9ACTN